MGELRATRRLSAPPADVFDFLADLRNHWRLEPRFVALGDLGRGGGAVRVRGPLGLSRLARTHVLASEAPEPGRVGLLRGRAHVGRATVGSIRWTIAPAGSSSQVTLEVSVERASTLDRLLLVCGGAAWLRAILVNALRNLEGDVRGEPIAGRESVLDWVEEGLTAGAVAAVVSGLPSTVHALVRGEDPLGATLAAGSLLLGSRASRRALLAAAVPVHVALSLTWGLVLARLLPPKGAALEGALAGVAIAALDLGVVGRRLPRVRALPVAPQLADHVAYGAAVGFVLARLRQGRHGRSSLR